MSGGARPVNVCVPCHTPSAVNGCDLVMLDDWLVTCDTTEECKSMLICRLRENRLNLFGTHIENCEESLKTIENHRDCIKMHPQESLLLKIRFSMVFNDCSQFSE